MKRCSNCANGMPNENNSIFCDEFLVLIESNEANDENNCDSYEYDDPRD